VGKTFPRFGCIALRAYLFSATGAGSFKPGATPQGNVAREDERCSDLSFDVDAVRESGGEDGKRRSRQVGKLAAAAIATWANCGRDREPGHR